MKNNRACRSLRAGSFMLAFLFLSVSVCVAFGSREPEKNGTQTIRGMVRIVGNEPHTSVALTTEDGSKSYLAVFAKGEKALRDLQGHLVDFSVVVAEKDSAPVPPGLDGSVEVISWKIIK